MTDYRCPNCRTDPSVGTNPTNQAAAYYCSDCDRVFDPPEWPCPSCERREDVTRNPFDERHDYYCYACDLVFDRLEPTINCTVETVPDRESTARTPVPLTVAVDALEEPTRGVHRYSIVLTNAGSTPIQTLGERATAMQHHVTDDDWLTLIGNPEGYQPAHTDVLHPNQTYQWEVVLSTSRILIGDLQHQREPLPSGKYRFVYWGLPEADVVPATTLSIEYDYPR